MAGIIKAGSWHNDASSLQSVAFNFEDMSHKASGYLEALRRQGQQIIEQAHEQARAIEARAQEQGRQAALAEARQTARDEVDRQLATLLPALSQAIEAIGYEKEEWLRNWERELVRLAAAIAGKIVRRELSRQPDITLDWVREALQLALGSGRVKLHLHPDDHRALGEQAARLAAEIAHLAPADVVADPQVTAGGCRVVTEFGVVDQTVEAQLARIEEELV